MRSLSASELLNAWEQALVQNPAQQALTLLASACPEMTLEQLSKLSIGQRNARLLQLRSWTFGRQLPSITMCPNCSEHLELIFSINDILIAADGELSETISLSIEDHEVRFRLPQSIDLIDIAGEKDLKMRRELLLERCLLEARFQDEMIPANSLPARVVEAVEERMAEADPNANAEIKLSCSSCNHQWQTKFDILSYFWSEINAWAQRTLREIHLLASTYGWREGEILSMSPTRRRLYLEMAKT